MRVCNCVLCVCTDDWSELCETHMTGPSGVLTGFILLIYLLTNATHTHTHICFIFVYLLAHVTIIVTVFICCSVIALVKQW